eukprot:Hpha_TRINITY_DN16964_c1_g1::TRINITY_DN16964_c1_g1_i1::g.55453::m.55453
MRSLLLIAAVSGVAGFTTQEDYDITANPMGVISSGQSNWAFNLRMIQQSVGLPQGCTLSARALAEGDDPATIPSKVVRVKKGDSVTFTYKNQLPAYPAGWTETHGNDYHDLDSTNMHTHGLHISGMVDDVSVVIHPGQEHVFNYQIPSNHAGGTFWYHPHKHGSTHVQAGSGAAGVLIVEDAPGEVPAWVSGLTEQVLFFFHMDLQSLTSIGGTTATGCANNLYLVNGYQMPIITIKKNEWQRWRIPYASADDDTTITFGGCELQLLAKDGVYLSDAPRATTQLPLTQASRADVLIRCPNPGVKAEQVKMGNTVVAHITVEDVEPPAAGCINNVQSSMFQVCRPAYLLDTFNEAVATAWSISAGARKINGADFTGHDASNSIHDMELGTVEEWSISANAHPLHAHVNHFQLQEDLNAYDKRGDWFDTFLGSATFRVRIDRFTGAVMYHCHILEHEDQGAMVLGWVYTQSGNSGLAHDGGDVSYASECPNGVVELVAAEFCQPASGPCAAVDASCSTDGDCCSGACSGGKASNRVCLSTTPATPPVTLPPTTAPPTPTPPTAFPTTPPPSSAPPTPTPPTAFPTTPPPSSCVENGYSCRDDVDCCSGDCSSGNPNSRKCLPQ